MSEAFVKAGGEKSLEDLEKELLNGQKLQGPETAAEVCSAHSPSEEMLISGRK